MIIPIQNILFSKEFLACSGCFRLFTKIKKEPGTSFCCIFAVWLFHKTVPYLILYQWTKFQCHIFFPSLDIQQNVLSSSYLDSWWRHKLQDLSWIKLSSYKAKAHREERGKDGNTKIWISREQKEHFRWNKKHLS